MLNRIAGFDSQDLVNDHDKIRAFLQIVYSCRAAESKFDREVDASDLENPTVEMATRIRRLERRYETLLSRWNKYQPEVIAIIKRAGCGVNRGGVALDGFIYSIVQTNAETKPTVAIIAIPDVKRLTPAFC